MPWISALRAVGHLRDAVAALERDLDVVPLLEEDRAVQLQAVVREARLPAELVVGQDVADVVAGERIAVDAARPVALGPGRVEHRGVGRLPGEVRRGTRCRSRRCVLSTFRQGASLRSTCDAQRHSPLRTSPGPPAGRRRRRRCRVARLAVPRPATDARLVRAVEAEAEPEEALDVHFRLEVARADRELELVRDVEVDRGRTRPGRCRCGPCCSGTRRPGSSATPAPGSSSP